jgi:predicted nucleic acid-binding protein
MLSSVWVSALVFKGIPGRAVEKAATEHIIAIAQEIYDEIVDVLNRPKFAGKVNPSSTVKLLEFILKEGSQWVSLRGTLRTASIRRTTNFLIARLWREPA